jgi:WD40 repeat protein
MKWTKSREEALQYLFPRMATLDEETWNLFLTHMKSQAATNQKAQFLLDVAIGVREMTPAIERLLCQETSSVIAYVFELVPTLNEPAWTVFQLVLTGKAQTNAYAQQLVSFAHDVRNASETAQKMLALPTARAYESLTAQIPLMSENFSDIFVAMLRHQARSSHHGSRIADYAVEVQEAHSFVQKLLEQSVYDAQLALTSVIPSLDDVSWNALDAMLQRVASRYEKAATMSAKAAEIHSINTTLNQILVQSTVDATETIVRMVPFMEDERWNTFYLILGAKAENSIKAQELFLYAVRARELREELEEHFYQVALAALLDDYITPEEQALLDEMRNRTNMTLEVANRLIAAAKEERRRQKIAEETLRQSVYDALEDSIITDEEEMELIQICERLRIPPDRAKQVIGDVLREYKNQQYAEQVVREYILEALSDDIITEEEQEEIDDVCDQLGIPLETAQRIIVELRQQREDERAVTSAQNGTSSVVPENENFSDTSSSQEEMFRKSLRDALADHVITQQEATELESLRQQLNFSVDLTRRLLQEVKQEMVKQPAQQQTSAVTRQPANDQTHHQWQMISLSHMCRGHTGAILRVAFTPDGQTLVTASQDKTIRLWNRREGTLLETLTGHNGAVLGLSVAPDGKILASASTDNTIRIWYPHNRTEDHVLVSNRSGIFNVAFDPDGKILASAGADGMVYLWNVPDGKLIHSLPHMDRVLNLAFSPDGKMLATASLMAARLWHVQDGTSIQTLWSMDQAHTDIITGLAFSPDATLLATSSADQTVRLWRVDDGCYLRCLQDQCGTVWGVTFSPDGQVVATASNDGKVRIWRVQDGTILHRLSGHTKRVMGIAMSPNGDYLATGSSDSTLRLWCAWSNDKKDMQDV